MPKRSRRPKTLSRSRFALYRERRTRLRHIWFAILAGRELPLRIDFDGPGFDPAEPTQATPGSPEKVEVMAARHAARMKLHHPKDVHLDAYLVARAALLASMSGNHCGHAEIIEEVDEAEYRHRQAAGL